MHWNWASVYWLLWISVGFCPVEFWALATSQPQYTLSYQVWHLEGQGATFARYFVAVFLIWLAIHMVLGKFT
jgi:hypothetical protein